MTYVRSPPLFSFLPACPIGYFGWKGLSGFGQGGLQAIHQSGKVYEPVYALLRICPPEEAPPRSTPLVLRPCPRRWWERPFAPLPCYNHLDHLIRAFLERSSDPSRENPACGGAVSPTFQRLRCNNSLSSPHKLLSTQKC